MKKNNILNIAFLPESNWIYPIINEINKRKDLLEKYENNDVREMGLSITVKLDIINLLVQNLNKENDKVRKELRENILRVNDYIGKNGTAYPSKNKSTVFLLLAYVECSIFEMKSTYDLLIKYATNFYKDILCKDRLGKKDFLKKCNDKGLDENWRQFLENIRDDLIHNYAGWISYEMVDSNFDLMVKMPRLKNKSSKKYKSGQLNLQSINALFEGFTKFLEITKNFLVNEIQSV